MNKTPMKSQCQMGVSISKNKHFFTNRSKLSHFCWFFETRRGVFVENSITFHTPLILGVKFFRLSTSLRSFLPKLQLSIHQRMGSRRVMTFICFYVFSKPKNSNLVSTERGVPTTFKNAMPFCGEVHSVSAFVENP